MKIVIPNVTAVAIDGRALLIAGEPGLGKSSLALMLIDRGATLIGDDGIRIVEENGHPHAHPPMTTEGLIEVPCTPLHAREPRLEGHCTQGWTASRQNPAPLRRRSSSVLIRPNCVSLANAMYEFGA